MRNDPRADGVQRPETEAWLAYCAGADEARAKFLRQTKPFEDECDAEIAALWQVYLAASEVDEAAWRSRVGA